MAAGDENLKVGKAGLPIRTNHDIALTLMIPFLDDVSAKDEADWRKSLFWEVADPYRFSTGLTHLPGPLTAYEVITPVFTEPSLLTTNHTLPVRHTIAAVRDAFRRHFRVFSYWPWWARLSRKICRPQSQLPGVTTMEDGTLKMVEKVHAPAWRATRPAWDRYEPVKYRSSLRITAGDET